MKTSLLFVVGISAGICSIQAQSWSDMMTSPDANYHQVVKAFESQRANLDYERGKGIKQYQRWKEYWSTRMLPDGSLSSANRTSDELSAYFKANKFPKKRAEWTCLGPYTYIAAGSWAPGQGRINTIESHPSKPNTWFAGAADGGIWRTTDAGANWEPMGDDFSYLGVASIAIAPQDANTIYLSSGDWDGYSSPSDGVMKSTDGGDTWERMDLGLEFRQYRAGKIVVSSTDKNRVFLVTNVGLMRSTDGGQSWRKIIDGALTDVDYKPGSSSIIYAAAKTKFYRSTNGGDTFSEVNAGISSSGNRVEIGVTEANPNVVYLLSCNSGAFDGVFKSSNSGQSFTKVSSGNGIGSAGQTWYDMAFTVSATNENTLFAGTVDLYRSTNGGSSFTAINSWNRPSQASYTHADIHYLGYLDGKLFCGSDGGVYISEDEGNSFYSRTDGLVISQYYSISSVDSRPDIIAGGLQDNGGYVYMNGNWRNYAGADGMESAVDPTNPTRVYGMIQNGSLYVSNNGGASRNLGSPESGEWVTPMSIDNNGRIIAGYGQVYEYNGGWNQLSDHNFDRKLRIMAVHEANPQIMVVGTRQRLYRSTNNGSSFTEISRNLNIGSAWFGNVEIHPTDPNIIWVVMSHWGQGNKCHMSTDGGQTWANISEGLPNLPMNVVRYEKGSNNAIYVGGEVGVYYRSDATGKFIPIFDGLPRTVVKDIEINEAEGFFRVGTHGRGVWQSDLYSAPSAQNDAALVNISGVGTSICGEFTPAVRLRNSGAQAISSATISFLVDGQEMDQIEWTGNLSTGESTEISFDAVTILSSTFDVSYKVEMNGDEVNTNNETAAIEITKAPLVIIPGGSETVDITVEVRPDVWGSEVEWELQDPEGTVVLSGGPYEDHVEQVDGEWIPDVSKIETDAQNATVSKSDIGCYTFVITDNGSGGSGDGIANPNNSEWGNGYFKIIYDNETLAEGGDFGKTDSRTIEVNFASGQDEDAFDQLVEVYPNPAQDVINLNLKEALTGNIALYDVAGRMLLNETISSQNITLDISQFSAGTYLIELETSQGKLKKQILRVP